MLTLSDRAILETQLNQQRQAATALESQRAILGDSVVEAALASINQHIATLEVTLEAIDTPGIQPAERQDLHSRDERRIVTVLFAEVEGVTAPDLVHDAEAVHDRLQSVWRRLERCVEWHRGTLDRQPSGNLMAIFGVPVAQEDDAVRGVQCGLALLNEMVSINAESESPLALRVGLHSGAVLASPGAAGDWNVMGDTVNVANRMARAAPVGQVLISANTEQAIRGRFVTESLGPINVKGKSEPIRVFLVQVARPLGDRFELRGYGLPRVPTIGREREMAELMSSFAETRQYRAQRALLLTGEAGLGKSRLLTDFWQWAADQANPPQQYMGRALPSSSNTPFYPWRVLWTSYFRLPDDAAVDEVLSQFADAVSGLWDDPVIPWREVTDVLAYMMGFGRGDSPHIAPLRRDGRLVRGRGFVLARALLQRLSEQQGGLLIALEDLHWADTATLDLLEYLLSSRPTTFPLMVVATVRPEFFERRPGWRGLGHIRSVEIVPLVQSQSLRLAEALLPLQIEPDILDRVVTQAEGNPYYIEELARLIYEQGEHVLTGDATALPDSLRRLLQARLDALAPEARAVMQHAAAVGRVFWPGAVSATDSRLPVAEVLPMLEARELIFRRPTSALDAEPEYTFKHSLLRDVAYEMLPRRERRQCHAAIAQWLASRDGLADEMAATLGDHYTLAGDAQQGLAAYRRAAESAVARAALQEATTLYRSALTLAHEPVVQFELLLALEGVYHLRGNRVDQRTVLDRLLEVVRLLDDPLRHSQAQVRESAYFEAIGAYHQQIVNAQRAVQMARQNDFTDAEIEGLVLWAEGLARQGDFPGAHTRYQEALSLAELLEHRLGQARSLAGLGNLASHQGDEAGARWFFESALDLYQELGDRSGQVATLHSLAELYMRQGAFQAAQACLEHGEYVAESLGDRRAQAIYSASLADLLSQGGDHAAAEARYSQCLATLQEIGDRAGELTARLQMGRARLRRREIDSALDHFRRARMLARKLGDLRTEASCLWEMGDVFAELGDVLHAQAAYSNALSIAREIGDQATIFGIQFHLALVNFWVGYDAPHTRSEARDAFLQLRNEAREWHMPMNEAMAEMALGMVEELSGASRKAIALLTDASEQLFEQSQGSLAANALAFLAEAYLDSGDPQAAHAAIASAFDTLKSAPVGFHVMPRQIVLHAAAHVAQALGHYSEAHARLDEARALIEHFAATLSDEGLRDSFLHNVPYNRAILEEWARQSRELR